MFKKIRITILLLILIGVALSAWRSQISSQEWRRSQYVALYPINADGSSLVTEYLARMDADRIQTVHGYIGEEAKRFGVKLVYPVNVMLGPTMTVLPPNLPAHASLWDSVKWSLQMRWWAWRNTPKTAVPPDVRLYLLYHDPYTERVPHSLGMQKGRMGVAHLYASRDMEGGNLVVMTHELLHTFGAVDKYDPATNQPLYPAGYAEPGLGFPQKKAEIMAGRIPLSESSAAIPTSLAQTVIGSETAHEIGWIKVQ